MKKIIGSMLMGLFCFVGSVYACTAMLITKSASKNNSVIVTHSDDNDYGDQRIIYVPSKDYPENDKRPAYLYRSSFPRYVGASRGAGYQLKDYPEVTPLGYIDQARHSYAYLDGNYAIMNEKQLAFGESTAEAKKILTYEKPEAGKRMLDIAELSRVAAERCSFASDAVKLMGSLAEKYGYYGKGEILLLADKNEGWLFEITGTPTGSGALWAAKRIPEGAVVAVANEFRIREIVPNDPDTLYSSNLFEVAKKYKLWDLKKGNLDWLATVSDGEYNHPYYSLRRVWRIYSLLDPKLSLDPYVKSGHTRSYPFAVKPAEKVDLRDILRIYRDHYEGTPFDLTKGVAAGAFNSPRRYLGDYDHRPRFSKDVVLKGAWERPISVYYTGYTTICETRSELPDLIGGRLWIGLDRADLTVFIPFYVNKMPSSYEYINPYKFDQQAMWWVFNFVSNWADLKYSYMQKDISLLQQEIEDKEMIEVPVIEKNALSAYATDRTASEKILMDYTTKNAQDIFSRWWQLAFHLIAKYNEGYVDGKDVGYSSSWLKETNYAVGPISYKHHLKMAD